MDIFLHLLLVILIVICLLRIRHVCNIRGLKGFTVSVPLFFLRRDALVFYSRVVNHGYASLLLISLRIQVHSPNHHLLLRSLPLFQLVIQICHSLSTRQFHCFLVFNHLVDFPHRLYGLLFWVAFVGEAMILVVIIVGL